MIAWPLILVWFAVPVDAAGWHAHVETLSQTTGAAAALRLASGLGRRGELAAARRWATEAERRGADPAMVEIARGDAARASGDLPAAVSAYFEVVRKRPKMAYAAVQLWHCLRLLPASQAEELGLDVVRVRTFLERAGYFVPVTFPTAPAVGDAALLTGAGFDALSRGDSAAAIAAFHSALEKAPLAAEAWRGLGAAEVRAGHATAARAAYQIHLSLEPPENQETRRIRRILSDDERRRGLAPTTFKGE